MSWCHADQKYLLRILFANFVRMVKSFFARLVHSCVTVSYVRRHFSLQYHIT